MPEHVRWIDLQTEAELTLANHNMTRSVGQEIPGYKKDSDRCLSQIISCALKLHHLASNEVDATGPELF